MMRHPSLSYLEFLPHDEAHSHVRAADLDSGEGLFPLNESPLFLRDGLILNEENDCACDSGDESRANSSQGTTLKPDSQGTTQSMRPQ